MTMTLRLRARGTALCPHFEAHESGTRRFIGRRYDRTLGFDEKDPLTGNVTKTGGFPSTGKVEEVPYRGEYIHALRDGDVWPADEETARVAGVPFDPTFGGEVEPELEAPKTTTA